MRRALAWPLILPFAAASILLGHGAAYALAGAPAGSLHAYLAHLPQVVGLLAVLALPGLAWAARGRSLPVGRVALLAAAGFVVQEHMERLIHVGEMPFLLSSPTFWLGLALQLPFAALVWLVARRLAAALVPTRPRRPPLLPVVATALPSQPSFAYVRLAAGASVCRGPPAPL